MYQVIGNTVDEIFALGWNLIHTYGRRQDSRAGPVISLQDVCDTEYLDPAYRVLMLRERDHNPYFALMETIWMMSGSNDLDFVMRYNKRMKEYSDDGMTLTGSAYGWHWINNYGFDQLLLAAEELVGNPETRRTVVSHWNPYKDPLNKGSKDLPCNLQILFRVVDGDKLNMTVYNRSNDFIYGQAGSNAVHFSFLLEFMAMVTGYKIGKYHQISNNLHMYTENPVYKRLYDKYEGYIPPIDRYEVSATGVFPLDTGMDRDPANMKSRYEVLMNDVATFTKHVRASVYVEPEDYNTAFFHSIIVPMQRSHFAFKNKDFPRSFDELAVMPYGNDWRRACEQWLSKRV